MKKLLLVALFFSVVSCSGHKQPERDSNGQILKNGQFYDSQEAETREVWICLGKSSHAYHSTNECYGITACGGEKKKISLDEALKQGRTPCHYCHKDTGTSEKKESYNPEEDTDPNKVYVCSGKTAKKYHLFADCPSLERCSGRVLRIGKRKAESMGKEPCRKCYE